LLHLAHHRDLRVLSRARRGRLLRIFRGERVRAPLRFEGNVPRQVSLAFARRASPHPSIHRPRSTSRRAHTSSAPTSARAPPDPTTTPIRVPRNARKAREEYYRRRVPRPASRVSARVVVSTRAHSEHDLPREKPIPTSHRDVASPRRAPTARASSLIRALVARTVSMPAIAFRIARCRIATIATVVPAATAMTALCIAASSRVAVRSAANMASSNASRRAARRRGGGGAVRGLPVGDRGPEVVLEDFVRPTG